MTEGNMQHLSEDRLLEYIETGMNREDFARARAHLHECRSCRQELEALEGTLEEFTLFYHKELLPHPRPPKPWKDLPVGRSSIKKFGRGMGLAAVGTLAAASLIVSRWHPEKTPVSSNAVPHPPQRAALSPKVERSEPKAPVPTAIADPNTEVRIFAALHRLNADAGEPVEVEFLRGAWQVSALGLSDARVASFAQELRSLPNVRVMAKSLNDFNPRQLLPATNAAEVPRLAQLPFQEEFDKYFSSRAVLEAFTNRALDHSQAILSRAHALQVLSQRFPSAVETKLGSEERGLLATMREHHRSAVHAMLPEIEKDISVLDSAISLTDAGSLSIPPIFEAAGRWDRLLGIIVGGAATDQNPNALKASLSSAASDLRRAIEELR